MTEEQPSPAPGEARRQWKATHPSGQAYTSWTRRRWSYIVDTAPIFALAIIVAAIGTATSRAVAPNVVLSINIAVLLAYWLWNWGYRQGTTGSSLGKSLLKFKVVSEESGEPIGFGRSVVRQIVHLLDVVSLVGFALPLFTARKQTIADMIMGTVFVPIEPTAQGSVR
jgi:uncharacterized RDD family membrane protein YckC